MATAYAPIVGPETGSPEWYEARTGFETEWNAIFASESAQACGISDNGEPLGMYALKRRLVAPFEGNDFTDRGKRFEPFIAGEYEKHVGVEVVTGLPMYYHPETRHIGATPDGVRKDDPRYGVEFKACNFRRAAQLGEQHSDDIFDDWLCQTQQQMYVMGWDICDVFVMVDLHTYRLYTVERNDAMIGRIVEIETELWDRIQRGDPPPPNYMHPGALELVKKLYGVEKGEEAILDVDISAAWERAQAIKEEAKELGKELDGIKARVLHAMGNAEFGRVPLLGIELVRGQVEPSLWTAEDARKALASVGQVKRKGYTTLRERKIKK